MLERWHQRLMLEPGMPNTRLTEIADDVAARF